MNGDREPGEPSWLLLNGYGVLVGMLEVTVATFRIVAWPSGALAMASDVGILLAGLLLLISYVNMRIDLEMTGSVTLVVSNLAHFFHRMTAHAPPQVDIRATIIQVIIIIAVSMRIAALVRGGAFVLPPWRR